MSVLFIGHTRVGDAVLSTGLLGHLVAEHSGGVTVACGPLVAPLFRAVPGVVRVIEVPKRPYSRHWWDLWRQVVGRRWDLVVDLRHSIIPWATNCRRRAIVPRPIEGEHRVMQMARTLGLGSAPPAPRLWTDESHEVRARDLIGEGDRVLGLGPTANWPGKTWPAERFAEVALQATGRGGVLEGARVAVFGAEGERHMAEPVLAALPPDRTIDLVGALDLPAVTACLKRCSAYIGNDSGLMHIAAAVGAPTLGLFGPSKPEHYAPWGHRAAFVRTDKTYDDLVGGPGYDHRTTGTLMGSLSTGVVLRELDALMKHGTIETDGV